MQHVPDELRHIASVRRTLPHFLIIGAQKGGTTSLYDYLCEHPQVLAARTKEPQYFSKFFYRGRLWYRHYFPSHFEITRRALRRGARVVTGEASPYYLYHPCAAERIKREVPKAKLIALLREPVARAYSHYTHNRKPSKGEREPLSFEEAIDAEEDRLRGEADRLRADASYVSYAHQHYGYLARSRYLEQLERYWRLFPESQLLVIRSEDLFENVQEVYDRVTDFLGLRRHALRNAAARNLGKYRGSRAIPREDELRARFAAENAVLEERLGWSW